MESKDRREREKEERRGEREKAKIKYLEEIYRVLF
jgi:hypothetical protein